MDHVRLQNRISHCAVRRDIAGLNEIKNDINIKLKLGIMINTNNNIY